MPPDPSSSEDKTTFTPAPSGRGNDRPASSRAGSSGLGWSPPTIEALQAMLPQYEIVSMLGHGGMGAVYKGKQISLDRMVAIKILPPGLEDDDAKFTERFKQEARTMAKMNHPGIVSVYDFGETAEGQFYFVMEYVDGTDVAKMIQASKKLPSEHALAIAAHVCDALAYAHGNGVVHRDIKPANILINQQGQVKVADFGLAKHEDPSQTSGLTKTGMAMGTPDYVAPEALIMGVNVDGRADLYAIGVMLYQMLTGDIPRGLFLMPSVKSNGEIDPRYDKIITRAMQTDREERYQKASEIRADLDVILTAPRVRQDASKAVAAVPQGAVKNVPDQRSAAQKPMPKGPGQPGAKAAAKGNLAAGGSDPGPAVQRAPGGSAKPGSVSRAGEKPKTGLYVGIAATVAVAVGLALLLKPQAPVGDEVKSLSSDSHSDSERLITSSSTTTGPIKTTEALKPSSPGSTPRLSPSSEPWVNAINNPDFRKVADFQGATLHFRQAGSAAISPTLKDCAVRMLFDHSVDSTIAECDVGVRMSASGKYSLRLSSNHNRKELNISVVQGGKAPRGLEFFPTAGKKPLPPNQPVELELRAIGNLLIAKANGTEIGRLTDRTLSDGQIVVHLAAGARLHAVETLDLSKPAPAIVSTPTTTSVGWTDGLAEWWRAGNNGNALHPADASGASLVAKNSGIFCGTKRMKDVAIRATVRAQTISPTTGFGFAVRGSPTGGTDRYHAGMSVDKGGRIVRNNSEKQTELKAFDLPAGFSFSDTHTAELRAQGDVLTFILDGQELARLQDAEFTDGQIYFWASKPDEILLSKLEYRELPAPAKPSATVKFSPSTEPWVDALADPAALELKFDATKTSDGLRLRHGSGGLLGAASFPKLQGPDYAVRLLVEFAGANKGPKLHFRRQDGKDYLLRMVPVPPTRFVHVVRSLPGKTEEVGKFPFTRALAPGHVYQLEARIVGGKISVAFDGVTIGSAEDTTCPTGTVLIGAEGPDLLMRGVQYLDLSAPLPTGSSTVAAGTKTIEPPSDGWIDGIAEWLAVPSNATKTTLQKEGTAWRYKGPESISLGARLSPPYKLANVAVRLTSKGGGGSIGLRSQGGAGNHYLAVQSYPDFVEIRRGQNNEYTTLAKFKLPPGFKKDASYVMEFRAEGDVLTLMVNGQTLGSVKDTTYSSGRFHVSPLYALIEKLEYRDLGSAAASAPAAPSPAGKQSNTNPSQQLPRPDGKPADMTKPVQVFILMGDTAMYGIGNVNPAEAKGTLAHLTRTEKKYPHLLDEKGGWTTRSDVRHVKVMHYPEGTQDQVGWLTVNGQEVGPELQFGHILGHALDSPVLLLKSCAGNRALGWDLLPPGSERFTIDGTTYAGYKDAADKWIEGGSKTAAGWYAGKQYDMDIARAKAVLADIGKHYPGAFSYEIAGFVFWHGSRDGGVPAYVLRYEQNLVNFIKAVRKEFNAPDAPFVMATCGAGGWESARPTQSIAEAQLAVGDRGKHPEFADKVKTVEARDFWRKADESPIADAAFNRNAATFMDVGNALGWAMAEMLKASASTSPTPVSAALADPKLIALLPNYSKAITNGLAVASAADKPAFEAELARLKINTPLPDAAEDAKLPAELKRLRGILRAQLGSSGTRQGSDVSADKSQSLFNGTSLDGWIVGGDPASFKVEDGCIKAAGPKGNLIYTGKGTAPAWKEFDLSMKVKTANKGNSGVWIHCPAKASGESALALEVQIYNVPSDAQQTGSIFKIAPVSKSLAQDDKWFDLRITVRGLTATVFIDGERANEWTQPATWTPPAGLPNARLGSGTIGLQGYGGQTWIKDVRITVP